MSGSFVVKRDVKRTSQNAGKIKMADVNAKYFKLNLLNLNFGTHSCARKIIYHECEVLIFKSAPRVTVKYHSAVLRDAKTVTIGTHFSIIASHLCMILIVSP